MIDLNYFNFQSNTISNLLGAIANPVMQIAGFMNVNIKSNTFQNSGRYIENVMSTWSQVTKYTSTSSDSISSTLCTLNAADDTYGFLTVGYSNMVNVLSNTVNNLFFTFGTSSLTATYGSFITFSYVAGPVTITTLTVTGQTGILGDYNLNTIGTLNSASKLTSFGNNMDSYQFVPLFTTDLTNKISPMKITLVTFDSWIGNLASTTLGGLFLTSLANTVNGYIDIVSLQIDQFTSNNWYIYGIGGLIYRVGPMTITNSKVTNYGSTKPSTTASTVSNGPPFANVLRPDNYSKFHTITMQNNLSGQYGASFYFGSDLTQTVTALTTNNFEIFSTTIQSWGGTSSILYINANSLIGQIDDLNLNSGTNAPLGSIYITGGKLTFNRATLLNNVGVTASDLNINLWTSWEVTFTSSSFSRTAIDTTTSPLTWNKVRAIYLNSAGTVTFTGTTFSNYLLVDRGGVIEAHSTKINLQSWTFNQNSADTGGVIYVDTQTTIAITSSTFTNNKANTQSGVLYFKTNCIVTIQSSTFTSNSATSDGLFTSIQYSQLTDVGSTFTSNTATLQNSIASFTQCTGSSFTNITKINNIGIFYKLIFYFMKEKDSYKISNTYVP